MPEILPDIIESDGFPVTLVFSKNGAVFFSERISGNLWQIENGDFHFLRRFPVVPVTDHHETGLLGIVLDPDFKNNDYIYCYYSYGKDDHDISNKVVRIGITDPDKPEEIILDKIPGGRIHNGGIMAFGPDEKLYIGVGVSQEYMQKAQDKDFLGGKLLRVNPDGSIPPDNPFPNSPVYSYGHRNIFGLAFHPKTGKLYICDVGPEKDDEINIIEAGGNYGWPEVTGVTKDPKYIDPIVTYTPTITPTQCVFFDDKLYFGSFNEGTVHRLTLAGENFDQVIADDIVYQGRPFGIVGVFCDESGRFYVTTPNRIMRFTPEVVSQ